MSAFVDKLEIVLGAELYRPSQQFIARFVVQPQVVHDFEAIPGAVVRMKRFGYWNDPGSYTQTSRARDKDQVIGTGGSRGLPAEEVLLTLQEFTGPSSGDSNNPNEPGVLKLRMMDLIQQQRNLYNIAQATQFHQSIGSETLFMDYKRWKDSIYINLLLGANPATLAGGQIASSSQGGYYNPNGIANGGTYNTTTGIPRLNIVRDLTRVVSDLRERNAPPYNSNLGDVYHALATPGFMRALRQDSEFRKVAQYPGMPAGMLQMSSPTLAMMPPIMNWTLNPNELVKTGGFYGQTSFGSSITVPTGIVFEGIRFFESMNVPKIPVTLTTSGLASAGYADGSAVTRQADSAIIFGQNTIGEGIWGQGPQVKINTNTDFDRFLIAIWQEYSGYTMLNSNNITVLRTFDNF